MTQRRSESRPSKVRVAAAVTASSLALGGLLGIAPTAQAAPADDIIPPVQSVEAGGATVDLSGAVTIVAPDDVDPAALADLKAIIAQAGGTATMATSAPGSGVAVYLGTADQVGEAVITAMDVAVPTDEEGYVLANGAIGDLTSLVLAGTDVRGTYYAVQSLRQVVTNGSVPALRIEDHPLMPIRGTIEGFYGIPWSHQARLDLLAFSGEHKLNTYIYTPKDDLLLRAQWRDLYSGDELDKISELVDQATAHHVDFTFALSPANDLCYSSQEDYDATIAKFDQLRDLGVTSFYIALDDIPLQFHCQQDIDKYPRTGDWHWLADAQADYLNRIQREYIEPNNLPDLQTVPTNYSGSQEDPYKGRFGEQIDKDIRVQWTGEGVFSDTVTAESVQAASQAYRTEHLYMWDNFPVNDGKRNRLFLKPLTGRDAELYQYLDGFTANPMIQPYASWIALANYADYTWNGPAYDPEASLERVLNELAGDDPMVQQALRAFVDLNQSWPYPENRPGQEYAPELSADMDSFWEAINAGDLPETTPLEERLQLLSTINEPLSKMAEPGFYGDVKPWSDLTQQWAGVLLQDVATLRALNESYGETASRQFIASRDALVATLEATVDDQDSAGVYRENQIVPTTGDGKFNEFDVATITGFEEWLGVTEPPARENFADTIPGTSMGTYSGYSIFNAADDDPNSWFWSSQAAETGDYVELDLGEVKQVGYVSLHQGSADTNGDTDMILDGRLEYSTDGQTWTKIGDYRNASVVVASLSAPVEARYVRLTANSTNPGGQWVKVREFVVGPYAQTSETSLTPTNDTAPFSAFDGNLETPFEAADSDGYLSYTFDAPRQVGSVSVVGTGSGDIELMVAGQWVKVGELIAGQRFHEATSANVTATAVRLSFDAGSPAPRIFEVVAREGGPVGVTEPVVEQCSASLITAGRKLVGRSTNAWGTASHCSDVSVEIKRGDDWSTVGSVEPDDADFYVVNLDSVTQAKGSYALRLVSGEKVLDSATLVRVGTTSVHAAENTVVGWDSRVWGSVDGKAMVYTQVMIPGGTWSTSQARQVDGGYQIPLTYGRDAAGTYQWRVVVDHGDGVVEYSKPFTQRRYALPSANTAGIKAIGADTYTWGTVDGQPGASVWTEVQLPDGTWSRSQQATTGTDGGFVIKLTYGHDVAGTYRWRVAARYDGIGVLRSEEFTLVRR